MLALKTTFDPVAAGDLDATIDLRVDDDELEVTVADGRLAVRRGGARDADATLQADGPTLRALAFGGRRLDEAATAGAVRVEGDGAALQRLLDAF
jgi:alkyl sulfatase BDS1-like metallo-beta-lactamase superfamily hydrolase